MALTRGKLRWIILIVAAPFYCWFFPSIVMGTLPRLEIVGIIFCAYLVLGYFVVRAIVKRVDKS
jgi:hypothetical protein